ncbi:bifunctional methylenetetrahydrofolate dehydrogenase/cyclohydrolase, mitochondrial-like [Amblyraja radiata]|uniref:bifunctional methylenetetrahydrofolate dehydrogenase/cyclohydrolase, mitochondrial-like n=1 Tax=Amblyraja radiata TaxID=386614 RepID=UPI001403DFCA|nr:bifunctional methylenetetrahydrofolate dehydrogenase/cyclohydrolase, mitochondrial-like [Amblyraja radiata]
MFDRRLEIAIKAGDGKEIEGNGAADCKGVPDHMGIPHLADEDHRNSKYCTWKHQGGLHGVQKHGWRARLQADVHLALEELHALVNKHQTAYPEAFTTIWSGGDLVWWRSGLVETWSSGDPVWWRSGLVETWSGGDVARQEAVVISGTALARQIHEEVRRELEEWVSLGNARPRLSVVLVGDDPGSHIYVKNKTKAAASVGISSETILRPSSVSQQELMELIERLNRDPHVTGLLVQLPLPAHIDERLVCNAVVPEKDVDGFHVVNVGRMCLDQRAILPATPAGVWEMIKRTGIETVGKNVVVVGRSKNVGMPIAVLLHTDGRHERPGGDATVTITHRFTPKEQLMAHTLLADIVIVAAGIPKLITADMIKEGAVVIDVGINRVRDPATGKTKLVGDADFKEIKKKASYLTPVPGGVGPMTVAMLMKNTLMVTKKFVAY